jgi:hypothetical protein
MSRLCHSCKSEVSGMASQGCASASAVLARLSCKRNRPCAVIIFCQRLQERSLCSGTGGRRISCAGALVLQVE